MRGISTLAPTVVVAVVLGCAPDARGSGTELPDPSAWAAGTGGATAARTGDPSAAAYNPAALVDGKGLRIGAGSLFALATARVASSPEAPPPAYHASPASHVRAVPYGAASYAWGAWAFGLSVSVPFGGGIRWPRNWPLRFEARESSTAVVRLAPFAGVRWRWLSFAAGPYVDHLQTELLRSTNHVTSEGELRVTGHGTGVGAHAGVLARPTEELAIGLAFRSHDVVTVDGSADFDVPPAFAGPFPDQRVSADVKLPARATFGIAWSPIPIARVLADVSYSFWSINDRLVLDFERPETPDATLAYDWRDTLALRAGGEVDVNDTLAVRAGGFVDGLPAPAAPSKNIGPSSVDLSRVGGSLGAGVAITESLALDAFYQYVSLLERTSTSTDLPLASYRGQAHLFGLGARFAWNPDPAPRRRGGD